MPLPPMTPQQQYIYVATLAKKHGLTIAEYLNKYNPETDSLREFSKETPREMDAVIITSKKRKKKDHTIEIVLLSIAALLIIFLIFKKSKK